MQKTFRKNAVRGFTMVEMAVVLTVVAIVTLLVLGGRDLLESNKASTVISELSYYKSANDAFISKYKYRAGDVPLAYATQFFSGNAATDCSGNVVSNGMWDNLPEQNLAWVQLSSAGMIRDKFTYDACSVSNARPGMERPASAADKAVGYTFLGSANIGSKTLFKVLRVGKQSSGSDTNLDGGSFGPSIHRTIDAKIDQPDTPLSGRYLVSANCVADVNASPAAYTNNNDLACTGNLVEMDGTGLQVSAWGGGSNGDGAQDLQVANGGGGGPEDEIIDCGENPGHPSCSGDDLGGGNPIEQNPMQDCFNNAVCDSNGQFVCNDPNGNFYVYYCNNGQKPNTADDWGDCDSNPGHSGCGAGGGNEEDDDNGGGNPGDGDDGDDDNGNGGQVSQDYTCEYGAKSVLSCGSVQQNNQMNCVPSASGVGTTTYNCGNNVTCTIDGAMNLHCSNNYTCAYVQGGGYNCTPGATSNQSAPKSSSDPFFCAVPDYGTIGNTQAEIGTVRSRCNNGMICLAASGSNYSGASELACYGGGTYGTTCIVDAANNTVKCSNGVECTVNGSEWDCQPKDPDNFSNCRIMSEAEAIGSGFGANYTGGVNGCFTNGGSGFECNNQVVTNPGTLTCSGKTCTSADGINWSCSDGITCEAYVLGDYGYWGCSQVPPAACPQHHTCDYYGNITGCQPGYTLSSGTCVPAGNPGNGGGGNEEYPEHCTQYRDACLNGDSSSCYAFIDECSGEHHGYDQAQCQQYMAEAGDDINNMPANLKAQCFPSAGGGNTGTPYTCSGYGGPWSGMSCTNNSECSTMYIVGSTPVIQCNDSQGNADYFCIIPDGSNGGSEMTCSNGSTCQINGSDIECSGEDEQIVQSCVTDGGNMTCAGENPCSFDGSQIICNQGDPKFGVIAYTCNQGSGNSWDCDNGYQCSFDPNGLSTLSCKNPNGGEGTPFTCSGDSYNFDCDTNNDNNIDITCYAFDDENGECTFKDSGEAMTCSRNKDTEAWSCQNGYVMSYDHNNGMMNGSTKASNQNTCTNGDLSGCTFDEGSKIYNGNESQLEFFRPQDGQSIICYQSNDDGNKITYQCDNEASGVEQTGNCYFNRTTGQPSCDKSLFVE